ncbi:hypothetical protein AB0C90_03460 [Streptomyces sp. NPDC048550]|uniref:nSTAND1 domain-containing NTPase n=1 Tax=Streptomyces sp. NPDC048550 TaxID=3155739 RepID=UPI00341E06A2
MRTSRAAICTCTSRTASAHCAPATPATPRPAVRTPDCVRSPPRSTTGWEHDWFRGREEVTAELLQLLSQRLESGGPVVVVPPAGAGESSLLRAGALPEGLGATGPQRVRQALAAGPEPTEALVREALRAGPQRPGQAPPRVVLLVDQLEELFTVCTDPVQRRAFVAGLARLAAATPAGPAVSGAQVSDRGC